MLKYRLYIDEVGNHDLASALKNPNERFLSLTGVAFDLEYVRTTLSPELEKLKLDFFNSHPDDPLIFHRKELSRHLYPFNALADEKVREKFDEALLRLIGNWEYTVFTAVLDKVEHQEKYTVWRFDPYHYCLQVIAERYVLWMKSNCEKGRECQGDVMSESRGGKEDRRLKSSFELFCKDGTNYVESDIISQRLTSRQLKVRSKKNNIAGLQLADLIAHPSSRAARFLKEKKALPDDFGKKVYNVLRRKYYASPNGTIQGWGIKWLP